ncbi:hypothetical protein [Aeromicrobium panaciterrae]|nr:hypothetical protein [Aeromicrobium panaciterrae]
MKTSIGHTMEGERWAESVAHLGDVGPGTWEISLTTRSGLRSSTSRFVAASQGPASLLGASSMQPRALSLSTQDDGLAVVVDLLPRQAQLSGLEVGFTQVVLTGTLLGAWPKVWRVIARCRSDKRELDMEWVVDGSSFSAAAPVASMAQGDDVWEFYLVNESGQRMPVRHGLPDGRDRRYDLSTPVQIVAFEGGTARVRGYCAPDGRVRLSVVPVGRAA